MVATSEEPPPNESAASLEPNSGGASNTVSARRLDRLADYLATNCPPSGWCKLPDEGLGEALVTREQAARIQGTPGDPQSSATDRLWGWGGPEELFTAWGSAAFDGRRLWFYGGGHHHWRGNNFLVYDLATLTWSRPYDPSYVTEETQSCGNKRYIPEKGPRATHAYDGLVYAAETHSIYLFGHCNLQAWRFDLSTWEATRDPWKAWTALGDKPFPDGYRPMSYGFAASAALRDGDVVLHLGVQAKGNGDLYLFDPATGQFSKPERFGFQLANAVAVGNQVYGNEKNGDTYVVAKRLGKALPVDSGARWNGGTGAASTGEAIVTWDGGRETFVYLPKDDTWVQLVNPGGAAPTGIKNGVWGKWDYVPGVDAFVGMAGDGMWAYRLPDPLPTVNPRKTELEQQGFTCADTVLNWRCGDLQQAVDRGIVPRGVYQQCATVDREVGFNDSRLQGKVCGHKAALIARDGAVIRDVHISEISTGVNAACIRWEGGDVTLDKVTCRHSDMGILGTGRSLTIRDSDIGETLDRGRNHGHVVYACSASPFDGQLDIIDSRIHNANDDGHVLKTGCARTRIMNSSLDGDGGNFSRVIDAFNGGEIRIVDSTIKGGPDGGNGDLIGFAGEMRADPGSHSLELRGGTVDCTRMIRALHMWPGRGHPVPEVTWLPATDRECGSPGAH